MFQRPTSVDLAWATFPSPGKGGTDARDGRCPFSPETSLEVSDIDPEIGSAAFDRAIKEDLHNLLAPPAPAHAERFDQIIDCPRLDAPYGSPRPAPSPPDGAGPASKENSCRCAVWGCAARRSRCAGPVAPRSSRVTSARPASFATVTPHHVQGAHPCLLRCAYPRRLWTAERP